MLVAVRAEVENVDRWREGFKTHGDVFASQKISIAYLVQPMITKSLLCVRPLTLMSL